MFTHDKHLTNFDKWPNTPPKIMDSEKIIAGAVGALITLMFTSIVKHIEKVNLNRNLRLMVAREIEESKHILSQNHEKIEQLSNLGLMPHGFRVRMWESSMAQAPLFLSSQEISNVEVFYRNLREIQDIVSSLEQSSEVVHLAKLTVVKEKSIALGHSPQCIGRQNLNWLNYYFVIWRRKGHSLGDLQYFFTYAPKVIVSPDYSSMTKFKHARYLIKARLKQFWNR
jgi:hypothetical protein